MELSHNKGTHACRVFDENGEANMQDIGSAISLLTSNSGPIQEGLELVKMLELVKQEAAKLPAAIRADFVRRAMVVVYAVPYVCWCAGQDQTQRERYALVEGAFEGLTFGRQMRSFFEKSQSGFCLSREAALHNLISAFESHAPSPF